MLAGVATGRKIVGDPYEAVPCRNRRWQLRQEAQGRCVICGRPAGGKRSCAVHRAKARARAARWYRRHAERIRAFSAAEYRRLRGLGHPPYSASRWSSKVSKTTGEPRNMNPPILRKPIEKAEGGIPRPPRRAIYV